MSDIEKFKTKYAQKLTNYIDAKKDHEKRAIAERLLSSLKGIDERNNELKSNQSFIAFTQVFRHLYNEILSPNNPVKSKSFNAIIYEMNSDLESIKNRQAPKSPRSPVKSEPKLGDIQYHGDLEHFCKIEMPYLNGENGGVFIEIRNNRLFIMTPEYFGLYNVEDCSILFQGRHFLSEEELNSGKWFILDDRNMCKYFLDKTDNKIKSVTYNFYDGTKKYFEFSIRQEENFLPFQVVYSPYNGFINIIFRERRGNIYRINSFDRVGQLIDRPTEFRGGDTLNFFSIKEGLIKCDGLKLSEFALYPNRGILPIERYFGSDMGLKGSSLHYDINTCIRQNISDNNREIKAIGPEFNRVLFEDSFQNRDNNRAVKKYLYRLLTMSDSRENTSTIKKLDFTIFDSFTEESRIYSSGFSSDCDDYLYILTSRTFFYTDYYKRPSIYTLYIYDCRAQKMIKKDFKLIPERTQYSIVDSQLKCNESYKFGYYPDLGE